VSIKNRRLALVFFLVVLGAGVFGVYAPGLKGPFVFDDYPNIVDNPLVAVDALDAANLRDAAFSLRNGPYPHRGLARLSFALNYYFAGGRFDAFAFKLTNVVIHVVNGLLVYRRGTPVIGAGGLERDAVVPAVGGGGFVAVASDSIDQRAVRRAAHDEHGGVFRAGGIAAVRGGSDSAGIGPGVWFDVDVRWLSGGRGPGFFR
jgi:hypothetical protein